MKSKIKNIESNPQTGESTLLIIPIVSHEIIEPKIKIYDYIDDGSFYYRKIGFNSSIIGEER